MLAVYLRMITAAELSWGRRTSSVGDRGGGEFYGLT